MKGVLTFHTETGTEGGFWAFQDERFIKQIIILVTVKSAAYIFNMPRIILINCQKNKEGVIMKNT